MNIDDVIAKTYELLEAYGKYASNSSFGDPNTWVVGTFDNKQRVLGCCNITHRKIEYNESFVNASDDDSVMDTIRHEVAHALAGIEYSRSGRMIAHGRTWKRYARMLGISEPKAANDVSLEARVALAITASNAVVCDHGDRFELCLMNKRRYKNIRNKMIPNRPETLGKLRQGKANVVLECLNNKDWDKLRQVVS